MRKKHKKRNITFLLGCLWFYIKRINDVECFAKATEIITELCIRLGVDWELVQNGAKAYETWDAFQSDCL